MATVYFAKWILLPDGQVLENGALAVSGTEILSVGPRGRTKRSLGDRTVNLGNLLLLPGLINMHTHLEESATNEAAHVPREPFAAAFAKANSRLRQATHEQVVAAVRLAARECLANGVTTVVDCSRRAISADVLAQEPIRSIVIQHGHAETREQEETYLEFLCQQSGAGVGPHALFSLHPDAQRRVIELARQRSLLWVTHLAESAEELQAFSEQQGDLFFHITRSRPWPYGRNPQGPTYYAVTNNLIPNGGICIHCNYVNGHELALLAAKRVAVVVCMRYTDARGHKPLPLDVALSRGITVCAGTESPAYVDSSSLFDELYCLKQHYPHLPAQRLLSFVTQNPANALGMGHAIGSLAAGKRADVAGVALSHDAGSDILEDLLQQEPAVRFVLVNGEEVLVDA